MYIWRINFLLLLFSSLIILFPQTSLAHPGNTASDGCHYCRTNCASWGEIQGARHCHGGYSPPANTHTAPTFTPKPTATPTSRPTSTPKRVPTNTPIPTQIPIFTPKPEVKGESDDVTVEVENEANKDVVENDGSIGTIALLGTAILTGGYWLYKTKLKS